MYVLLLAVRRSWSKYYHLLVEVLDVVDRPKSLGEATSHSRNVVLAALESGRVCTSRACPSSTSPISAESQVEDGIVVGEELIGRASASSPMTKG